MHNSCDLSQFTVKPIHDLGQFIPMPCVCCRESLSVIVTLLRGNELLLTQHE